MTEILQEKWMKGVAITTTVLAVIVTALGIKAAGMRRSVLADED